MNYWAELEASYRDRTSTSESLYEKMGEHIP